MPKRKSLIGSTFGKLKVFADGHEDQSWKSKYPNITAYLADEHDISRDMLEKCYHVSKLIIAINESGGVE